MLYFFATICLAIALSRLAWIDTKTYRLPDRITLPLVAAGLALAPFEGGTTFALSGLGGLIGYLLFWAVGHFYFHRRGTEGLGLGDAKLFAASGTWLGALALPHVLLAASLTGLAVALLVRSSHPRIAFGPWLALAFFGVWIQRIYL